MKKEFNLWELIPAFIIFAGIGWNIGFSMGRNDGQKDALLGKQKYEMIIEYKHELVGKKTIIDKLYEGDTITWFTGTAGGWDYGLTFIDDMDVIIAVRDSLIYENIPVDTLIINKK